MLFNKRKEYLAIINDIPLITWNCITKKFATYNSKTQI